MPALPHESTEIDGVKFTTTKFPSVQGFRLLTRLTKAIGPAVLMLSKLDPDTELDPTVLVNALGALDPDQVDSLLPQILAGTTALVSDEKGARQIGLTSTSNIDMVFNGRDMMVMFKVIGHALQTNYAPFSKGSAAAVAAPQATSGG